jgi:hypothetical protein
VRAALAVRVALAVCAGWPCAPAGRVRRPATCAALAVYASPAVRSAPTASAAAAWSSSFAVVRPRPPTHRHARFAAVRWSACAAAACVSSFTIPPRRAWVRRPGRCLGAPTAARSNPKPRRDRPYSARKPIGVRRVGTVRRSGTGIRTGTPGDLGASTGRGLDPEAGLGRDRIRPVLSSLWSSAEPCSTQLNRAPEPALLRPGREMRSMAVIVAVAAERFRLLV